MHNSLTKKQSTFFIVILFATFFVYALYMNIYGTNAQVMMKYYDINAAQQGFIITVQSVGGVIFSFLLALYGERFNKIYVLLFGLVMFALSTLAIGFAPNYAILVILSGVIGVGLVCVDVMMNGVISDVFPKTKNTLLSITHAFYGLGSMLSPFIVVAIVKPEYANTYFLPFLMVGIVAVVVAILFFGTSKKIVPLSPYADKSKMQHQAKGHPAEIFKTGRAWALLSAGVLYFSFQIGIGMWLPTYCAQVLKMDFDTAGIMLTVFFGGALIMRFLGPLIMRKLPPKKLFVIFNVAAAGVMFLAINTTIIPIFVALILLCGFLQGSSVVCLVIIAVESFPTRTASASSLAVFAVNGAFMTAPLWMGEMADNVGFLLPMYIICCMLVLSSYIVFRIKINNK